MAQLDAFIASQKRQIDNLNREVSEPAPQAQPADQEVPEGTIIRNPQTGQRMQVVNGQFVEIQ